MLKPRINRRQGHVLKSASADVRLGQTEDMFCFFGHPISGEATRGRDSMVSGIHATYINLWTYPKLKTYTSAGVEMEDGLKKIGH